MKKGLFLLGLFILFYYVYSYPKLDVIKVKDLPAPNWDYESEELYAPISIHDELHEFPLKSFYFFDGWEFIASSNNGCLSYYLTLKRVSDGLIASTKVTQRRDESFINRWSGCLVGSNTGLYAVMLLNSRYFAFFTSDPGYVFFDRKEHQFIPYVLQTKNCIDSKLFTTKAGLVLIHDSVSKACQFSEKLNEKESWHVARSSGFDLSAPVSRLEMESAEHYKSKYSYF